MLFRTLNNDHNNKKFHSDISEIRHLQFFSREEVILANAIFENVKGKFEINEFVQMLKFTFRILDIKSKWTE